jgi:hypothetical protein
MIIKKALLICLMIMIATSACYASGTENNDGVVQLFMPDENWVLEAALPGFKIDNREINAVYHMILATNEKTGVVVSIFLSYEGVTGDTKQCRDFYLEKIKNSPGIDKSSLKTYSYKQMEIVEYYIREFMGTKIDHKNMNAYIAQGDVWIDIHVSTAHPLDDKFFYDIIDSIAIKPHTSNSYDYFYFGSKLYRQKNYPKAIKYYDKAFALEKQEPKLNKVYWRVLIDCYGVACGIMGELNKTKDIFEYGIEQDPTYPMFYYHMACYYAEVNDMTGALASLEKAYKYKENMIKGERFPDPKKDGSFRKWLDNANFLQALERMAK